MNQPTSEKDLILIPCCGRKMSGGIRVNSYTDPIWDIVSDNETESIVATRTQVLTRLRCEQAYTSGKFAKNADIQVGPEFGVANFNGLYLPAVDRYIGNLYEAAPEMTALVKSAVKTKGSPRVLILSALYGPLHPLSLIQDYNLQMSQAPAFVPWKTSFPDFLEHYVVATGVRELWLYVGKSTPYYKVALAGIRHIYGQRLIKKATQFEVRNGSSSVTPRTHGQLLASHLSGSNNSSVENRVEVRTL